MSGSASVSVAVSGSLAVASTSSATAIIGAAQPTFTLSVPTKPHWHLEADHHDPVAYGIELVVVGICAYAGCKLIAERRTAFRTTSAYGPCELPDDL
jgi:hypothetical protein